MAAIKAVLFDLDGTTLYTLPDLRSAANFALERNGFSPITLDETRRFIGNGLGNLVRRALPADRTQEQIRQVLEDLKNYYAAHMTDETVPYEGIPDLLLSLRQAGYRIGTVSNKVDSAANALMPVYFGDLIDVCVGEREGVPRKPDPAPVRLALDALGVGAEETVYVGDSEVDVQTARNAGCPGIAVLWGYRTEEELRAAGAERFASDPRQLGEIIRSL